MHDFDAGIVAFICLQYMELSQPHVAFAERLEQTSQRIRMVAQPVAMHSPLQPFTTTGQLAEISISS
jgi:hypothetical protein